MVFGSEGCVGLGESGGLSMGNTRFVAANNCFDECNSGNKIELQCN